MTRPDPATVDPDVYLRERYLDGTGSASPLLRGYYALKPLIPRRLQLALRRRYARRQAVREFPAWPVEPLLVEHREHELRERMRRERTDRVAVVAPWPGGARYASVLTHDVEGPEGIELIPAVREVERRHGFASAWYFVAQDYPIPGGLFDELRADGCEVGLHGIHHDGKLFGSRERFEAELPLIHRYLREWEADGFRSPATHRNPEWMPELACLYDTSFSDTAPFEPQAGGCCSIWPYFLDDLVELPMTLVMDHTLWEILRETTVERWTAKAEWVARHNGLVNLLVHPDYVDRPERLAAYDEYLAFLRALPGGWHALPREVAAWWRARAPLRVQDVGEGLEVEAGGSRYRATRAWARAGDGGVALEA